MGAQGGGWKLLTEAVMFFLGARKSVLCLASSSFEGDDGDSQLLGSCSLCQERGPHWLFPDRLCDNVM